MPPLAFSTRWSFASSVREALFLASTQRWGWRDVRVRIYDRFKAWQSTQNLVSVGELRIVECNGVSRNLCAHGAMAVRGSPPCATLVIIWMVPRRPVGTCARAATYLPPRLSDVSAIISTFEACIPFNVEFLGAFTDCCARLSQPEGKAPRIARRGLCDHETPCRNRGGWLLLLYCLSCSLCVCEVFAT
jgi:hypothetical protein